MTRIVAPLRLLLGLCLALFAGAALAGPALADAPLRVEGHVDDRTTEQVAAGDRAEIEAAAARLAEGSDLDLFTVYVDSFDGMDHQEWADETATMSGLGQNDILLAIAVVDREYAVSVGTELPLSDSQLATVAGDIEDELRQDDWSGAAITAADGYLAQANGGGSAVVPVLIGAGVIGGGAFLLVRSSNKRKRQQQAAQQHPGGPGVPGRQNAPAPANSIEAVLASLSTEDLAKRAGSALVGLDDDVRSSEQELGFAQAQFGLQSTQNFKAVVEGVKGQLAQAFALQQRLDDTAPESEPEKRQILTQIVLLCDQGDKALDAQAESFADLRKLQDNAPQLLDEINTRAGEIEARIPAAQATLTQLRATYPETALVSVARAPDQAAQLLDAARDAVTQGRERVTGNDRGTAVAFAHTAEDALAQAVTLLDSVTNAHDNLSQAVQRLDASIASITADVADAERLAPQDPQVGPATERARTAIEAATAARQKNGDPLAALTEIVAAEQSLDAVLAGHREASDVRRRAESQLQNGLSRTDALIRSTNTYIETHRGAVGANARTRLASAIESLQQARAMSETDPVQALRLTTAAWHSAKAAQDLAASDVSAWERSRSPYSGGGYSSQRGVDPGSLILGGILGNMFGGNDNGYRGGYGGRGGSSWGSSWGGGGSSWGGGSSRSSSRRRSSSSRSSGSRRSGGRSGGGRRSGGGGRF
ncbi:TPM domain-containing protein [Occultella gossypii]|uniref:TPM domain-containing protein n=1 Tax=Occultella gossypii TaxID=2800820 RepID=A0ABS7SFP6_9MICO|nr:TPM domain-containing protein [Occultella gossypii]MBZ2199172.1 TPM domain-containing protein [Occultella gossypii]